MNDFSRLKVYSPGYEATHWGFDYSQIVSLEESLSQQARILVLPVYFDNPREFSYRPEFEEIPLDQFDLVLFTDIEFRRQTDLIDWISTTGANNWLLAIGGLYDDEILDPRTIYRPSWSFTFLQWAQARDNFPLSRPYLFDCLCGTRREHRDYVMLALEKHGLLDQGIATYRDIFIGGSITQTPNRVANEFPEQSLTWPYVSPNLDPRWEVREKLDNSISSIIPWEIYDRTYFSILVETLGSGNCYLMAEKIGKCLYGKRLFVHFGAAHWLKRLRSFGFQTFESIINESYDNIKDDILRWRAAFDQVLDLSRRDLPSTLSKIRPILDHNHRRLSEFRLERFDAMRAMIEAHLR